MFVRLIIVFTLLPLIEIWLLMKIREWTSLPLTVGLVLVTGCVGAILARRQGLRVWRRIQERLSRGQSLTSELLDGMMILMAGAVLITPGVLTDLAGFALLVPAVRSMLKTWAASKFKRRTDVQFPSNQSGESSESESGNRGPIIDAEFTQNPDQN